MDATFMESITSMMEGVDGPTSIFIAGQLGTGILIATIVSGLIVGLFGLKLYRVLAAVEGLAIGALIGFAITGFVEVSEMAAIGIIAGCGLVLALLLCLIRRVGAFTLTLLWTFSIVIAFAGLDQMLVLIIAIVLAFVMAILAAIFLEPIIIIVSSFAGAVSAAPSILMLARVDDITWLTYAATGVVAIICMMVQFMMQSRKIGKKEKVYSANVRKSDSVESEVERARMILDDDDEDEE